jgi:hypothetical protein
MSFYTCPIATVHAPLDKVSGLLSDPSRYALWWGAQTRSISPAGLAIAGQKILAQTKALGKEVGSWNISPPSNCMRVSREHWTAFSMRQRRQW